MSDATRDERPICDGCGEPVAAHTELPVVENCDRIQDRFRQNMIRAVERVRKALQQYANSEESTR